jgi:hypothetical protein
MKKLTAVSLFSAAVMIAGLAQAQTAAPATSRAQVIAELQQARDSGELAAMQSEVGLSYASPAAKASTAVAAKPAVPAAAATTGKSRADVVAELQRARASGELDAIQSEGGPSYYPQQPGRLSGAPVLAGK